MKRLAHLLAAGVLVPLLSAAAIAGGGSNTRTDPCALVTADEVKRALGETAATGQNNGIGDCLYRGASGYNTSVTISVDENPGRRDYFDAQLGRDNITVIDDIGDGAFAFESSAGFVQITAIKGETLVSVMISGGQRPDLLRATTELAGHAAARLGTEAVLAKVPGLEALVGRWMADAGDPSRGNREMRSWVIAEDGSWSLTMAPEYLGMLTAENGNWRMESQQENFGGGYEIDDADSFTTSGDVAAEWTRVADGEEPEGIDPDFLGIWTRIPLGGMAQGPLDPALVGLWQATLDGPRMPTILVWHIGPAGWSTLTEVISVTGELSAENGQMEMRLGDEPPLNVTYQFQGRDAFLTNDPSGAIRWQRRGTGLAPN
jgi:hypothetical protein